MSPDRFVSYAQNLEDVMLWRALHGAVDGPGFYIDVGASHPTNLSVTRAFYDRGWRGLNIEPLPEMAAALAQARPRDVVVQAACGAAAGRAVFHRVEHMAQTGLSTLDAGEAARHAGRGARVQELDVPVATLAELCRQHVRGDVHFLKIDAEGAEAEVLAGADLGAVRPWIVLVEATRPATDEAPDLAWEPALLDAGYRFVWFDGLNRFYLAHAHADLARHFELPPNVFDAYQVHDFPLQEHLVATETLALARLARIEVLEHELARAGQALPPDGDAAAIEPTPEPPEQPPLPATPAMPAEPMPPAVPAPLPAAAPARRSLGMLLYRLLRPVAGPVLRPVAWRLRTFLVSHLENSVAQLQGRHDTLLARVQELADRPPPVFPPVPPAPPPPPPPPPAPARPPAERGDRAVAADLGHGGGPPAGAGRGAARHPDAVLTPILTAAPAHR